MRLGSRPTIFQVDDCVTSGYMADDSSTNAIAIDEIQSRLVEQIEAAVKIRWKG